MSQNAPEGEFPSGALAITVSELAGLLRMSNSWVYKQVEAGTLPHVKLGTNLRFSREHVEKILNGRSKDEPRGGGSRVKAISKMARPS